MELNSGQRSYLIGESHDLNPLVHVGKDGLSAGVFEQTDKTLEDHELIKIRVNDNSPLGVEECAEELAENTGAAVVQTIGSVAVLYRENPEIFDYNLPD